MLPPRSDSWAPLRLRTKISRLSPLFRFLLRKIPSRIQKLKKFLKMSIEDSVPATPLKTKKKAASKPTAKKPISHPSYNEMVAESISALKDKRGSSKFAIKKHILAQYRLEDTKMTNTRINLALKRGVSTGKLVINRYHAGMFKNVKEKKAGEKKPKAAAKKTTKAIQKKKSVAPKKRSVAPKKKAATPKKTATPKKGSKKEKTPKKVAKKTPVKKISAKKPAVKKARRPAKK